MQISDSTAAPSSLSSAAELANRLLSRRSELLDLALSAMRRDLDEDHFAAGLGHFREALGLSRGLAALKARVDHQAERYSAELLPDNWRVAKTILQEAGEVDPPLKPDPELQKRINEACHNEQVSLHIHTADRLCQEGKPEAARLKLAAFLALYPTESRILERMEALNRTQPAPPSPAPAPARPVPAPPASKIPAPAAPKTAATSSPQSQFDAATSFESAPAPAQSFPAQDDQAHLDDQADVDDQTNFDDETDLDDQSEQAWRARIVVPHTIWDTVQNFSAIAASLIMLSTAGFLVLQHYTKPAPAPRPAVYRANEHASFPARPAQSTTPHETHFENVSGRQSEQELIMAVIRSYSATTGMSTSESVLDNIAIRGNQATARYRPKNNSSHSQLTFDLARKAGVWVVQGVQ